MSEQEKQRVLPLSAETIKGEAIWEEQGPIDFLVAPIFPRGSVGLIAAYGGSLKTWLLQSLALAVARRELWLGAFEVQGGRVLYLDYEQGEFETRRRFIGLADRTANIDMVSMPSLYLTDADFEARIKPLAKHYDLICIDSLRAGSEAECSENDPKFARPLRRLKGIAAKTGCVFIILHHNRKTRTDRDGAVVKDDRRERLAGSGAIHAAADSILSCELKGESETYVEHVKKRGGLGAPSFVATLDGMAPGRVSFLVLTEQERRERAENMLAEKLILRIVAQVKKMPGLSGNKIHEVVGGRKETFGEKIAEAIRRGLIRKEDGGYVPAGAP